MKKELHNDKKEPREIFYLSFFACIFIIGFGVYLSIRGGKNKSEFQNITGTIDYFDKTFQNLNKRDHRYIHLSNYPLVFDLFIGKRTGDFSPKFEQLDKLNIGDEITIYHADKTPFQKNRDLRLNKTVQFIDKGEDAYFIRGNKDKYGGYLLCGLGILFAVTLVILKQIGKIK
ncbi:hypothetical protein [Tenacibaculum xiamenense]|uniref:hypothetical protein n=1 Tax=Tenacibaculum xiamenense TaxID=1261553 RepID=UPI003894B109